MKSLKHEQMGDLLDTAARDAGVLLVLTEHDHVDRLMIAVTSRGYVLIGGEIELSEKHAIPNCLRDLTQVKCHAVIAVCPDDRTRNRVVARITRYLPHAFQSRVAVFTCANLKDGSVTKWISSMVGRGECLSHGSNKSDSEVHHDRS
jgi:hypothetical protein